MIARRTTAVVVTVVTAMVCVRTAAAVEATMTTIAWAPAMVHAAISAAIPSATHADATVVECVAVIPRVSTVNVPCVTAVVCCVEVWTTVVEVVAVRIVSVDAEVPVTIAPVERAVEIVESAECAILPVEEHVREIEVTTCPVVSIDIVVVVDAHEVVEVDLESSLILLL